MFVCDLIIIAMAKFLNKYHRKSLFSSNQRGCLGQQIWIRIYETSKNKWGQWWNDNNYPQVSLIIFIVHELKWNLKLKCTQYNYLFFYSNGSLIAQFPVRRIIVTDEEKKKAIEHLEKKNRESTKKHLEERNQQFVLQERNP